jgi:hypothetical protein
MSNSTLTPEVNNTEWNQAADKAKEVAVSVGQMASHAASAVGVMASQAATDVGRKADEFTASAGVGIQGLGDRLGKQAPQSGLLGSVSHAAARTVKEGGEYIENAKLSGMTEDIAQLVRRNPIPAVLIAIGLGWFVGRKLGS